MRAWIMALVILLVGCSGTVWSKPGGTVEDFERDKHACVYGSATAGDPIFAALFLPDCLQGKGWVRGPAPTVP